MKKILFGAALFVLVGCAGNTNSEKAREDSGQDVSTEQINYVDTVTNSDLPEDSVTEDTIVKKKPKPTDIIGSYTITGPINKGTTIYLLANGTVKVKKKGMEGLKYKKMKDGAYYKLSYFEDDTEGGVEWLQCIVGDNVYDVGSFASEYPGYDDYYYDEKSGKIVYTAKQKWEDIPLPPPISLSSLKKVGVVTWNY